MRLNKKKVLVIALLLAIAAGAVGYYMYNKGPLNVKTSSSLNITARLLYDDYTADTTAALKKYAGRVLQVSGVVSKVSNNQQEEMLILLNTNADGAFVNCTLQQKADGIKENDSIKVKGICSGIGQGEPELGIKGDIYLTQSIVVE